MTDLRPEQQYTESTLARILDLERTVEQLRENFDFLEDRLESFMTNVSGHSHWLASENETEPWYS